MPSFRARPIMIGQPWSCLFKLAGAGGSIIDLTGADLVATFRRSAGMTTALLEVRGGAVTVLAPDELRVQITAQQTRQLVSPSVAFAIGRRDGGLRDLTPTMIWPVRMAMNQEA